MRHGFSGGDLMRAVLNAIDYVSKEGKFKKTAGYIQHGVTSCMLHTIAVAYYSDRIAKKMHIRYRRRELLIGALLHDYFLYDWHDKAPERKIHGFTHPRCALINADRDFELTKTEKNIIVRHMFPLTLIPPKVREAWIVCAVDKICSVYEVFSKNPYTRLRAELALNNVNVG